MTGLSLLAPLSAEAFEQLRERLIRAWVPDRRSIVRLLAGRSVTPEQARELITALGEKNLAPRGDLPPYRAMLTFLAMHVNDASPRPEAVERITRGLEASIRSELSEQLGALPSGREKRSLGFPRFRALVAELQDPQGEVDEWALLGSRVAGVKLTAAQLLELSLTASFPTQGFRRIALHWDGQGSAEPLVRVLAPFHGTGEKLARELLSRAREPGAESLYEPGFVALMKQVCEGPAWTSLRQLELLLEGRSFTSHQLEDLWLQLNLGAVRHQAPAILLAVWDGRGTPPDFAR